MAWRRPFADAPIGRKLLLTALLVTGLTLAALSGLSVVKEFADWRSSSITTLTTEADVLATASEHSLRQHGRAQAAAYFARLAQASDIEFAGLYDRTGAPIARYGPPAAGPARLLPPQRPTRLIAGQVAEVTVPVLSDGQVVGAVRLHANLHEVWADLVSDSVVSLAAAAIAFGVAALLIRRTQRSIVGPIVELSAAMQRVLHTRTYDVRVTPRSRDEVGVLAEGFNAVFDAVQERDQKLARHGAELEQTVRQRTLELKQSNEALQAELVERKAAQEELHAHDAMLKTVAFGASELLETTNFDSAVSAVLELVGKAMVVNRVQLCDIRADDVGHLRLTPVSEWVAGDSERIIGDPRLHDIDVNASFPSAVTPLLIGERVIYYLEDFPSPFREIAEQHQIQSMLLVPILTEGKLSGALAFMDPSPAKRQWTWAETDTLYTLAGLLAVSRTRARYVQELADANTIVQNSPTVLYRMKGEPPLPLTYVSHNVVKYGYTPKQLVGNPNYLDLLVYPDDRPKVMDSIENVLAKDSPPSSIEFRLLQPGGVCRWVETRYTPVRDEVGRLVEVEGILVDITERKAAEDRIALLARTDGLTGLANRATFVERLHQAFIATRRGASAFAVLYLDLDHFKDVNDTRGHPAGDVLLRAAGERLKNLVRESDLVARLGGDEFAVLQMDIADPSDAGALASKIRQALAEPYRLEGTDVHLSASIGISPFTPELADPDAMLSQADLALYRAKDEGRNQYRFHTEDLDEQVNERVVMAEELHEAIEADQLFLHFQPQVELQSGKIVGMEALVRWKHPRRGVLSPAEFLPIAERTGASQALGHWVLEHTCLQMKAWRDAGVAPAVIAVNLSMNQLKGGQELVADITDILARTGVEPEGLELDVTESMLAKVTLARNDVIDRLKTLGVRIALDDFGMEYSSFDYLRTYRVSHLKVAREFIENATRDDERAATVRAIIGLARELGIQVIAEGVETHDQRALLLSMGPSAKGQGFYFSEPVAADAATELLRQGAIDPARSSAA